MHIHSKSIERRRLLSIEAALALMISFGSFVASLIFGILTIVKNDKKK